MNKAEKNSFGQSGQPKKLQAPAKRRELAKKISRPYNMANRKKFSEYLKTHPPGTQKGDRKAMFEHNRQEWDK